MIRLAQGRVVSSITIAIAALIGVFALPGDGVSLPDRRDMSAILRSFSFSARIETNADVAPFKIGESIKGTFTYDLFGRRRAKFTNEWAHYESRLNSLTFTVNGEQFECVDVVVGISSYRQAETFNIFASDLRVPKGWSNKKDQSTNFSWYIQNAPPRQMLNGNKLPSTLRLEDFQNSRNFVLDFGLTVQFPGGEVEQKSGISATIVELIETKPQK